MNLGSGELAGAGVGPKAAMLDRAAMAGLPVPAGYVVRHGDDVGPAVTLRGPLAVRSAFSIEDGDTGAMAGRFETVLDVRATTSAITDAVATVRASAQVLDEEEASAARLDVLVMEQVEAVTSGVAFTEQQYEDDLVNVTFGLADRLMAGHETGDRELLPKLRRWERPNRSLEPWAARLSALLARVRRLFGDHDWDVEWADDGTTCWLVQVRPVTAAPVRNEAFTVANHKEILPELPSTLMTSIIEAGSPDLLRFWADADSSLPVHRSFVETFLGRPYLNLSMLTDLMRALGLPTRLVTDSYGGEPDVDVGLRPLRLVAKAPTLLRIGLSQLTAVRSAERAGRAVEEAVPARPGFTEALNTLIEQYVTLVAEMSSLASSLAPPTAVLKSLGTLDAHLVRHRTAATLMLSRLEPLREVIAAGGEPGDPDFDKAWAYWIERHGHRGVFESDIARPRFRDDPDPILAAARAPHHRSTSTASSDLRRRLTSPIWLAVKRSMTAREDLRDRSMRGFAATRDRLVALAEDAVEQGLLPEIDAIWDLTRDELESIDRGTVYTAGDLEERRAVRAQLLDRRLPDTVHRFDDLDAPLRTANSALTSVYRGLSLVKGRVSGVALRASEPPTQLPAGFDPASTVLVARSVDAGWVPIFGQVAGVAVEIGGDLSHGSIVLRELGIPAATNLGEIGDGVKTGDQVELRASAGVLELVASVDGSSDSISAQPADA